jgi:hypothetical protein
MPSSRVINLLISGAVLLGSSAGVFAVGSTVTTGSSHPEVSSEDPGAVDSSSPQAAADTPAAAAPSGKNAPASTVSPAPKPKAGTVATGAGSSSSSATGSSGGGSAAAGSGGAASSGGTVAASAGSSGAGSRSSSSGGTASSGRVFIGATSGGHKLATSRTGVGLADHAYSFFSNRVPQAEMITVKAKGTTWREVANAKAGSALHGQIAAWARTIKARGGSVILAYSHEPEAGPSRNLGSPAEYVAAWRRVTTIFDEQGATNVVWAWQMTAYAFKAKPGSHQHAMQWYPGDDVIDIVAADGYNWGTCRGRSGSAASMADFTDPVIAFAKAHGKRVILAEFGADAGSGRAAWLQDAHRYLVANRDMIVAAFYFNLHDPGPCAWTLTTTSEYAALRAMALDTVNFRV